ncbi:MAG: hypothetical protein AAGI71_15030 [Bacteroidota bacterium]
MPWWSSLLLFVTALSALEANTTAAPPADALNRCTCVTPRDAPLDVQVRGALQGSDVVFAGRVVSGRVLEGTPLGISREYLFQVTEQWKGDPPTVLRVRTGAGGGDCGYPFELDRPYLVYANRGSPDTPYAEMLITDICRRTAPLPGARADVAVLRELE